MSHNAQAPLSRPPPPPQAVPSCMPELSRRMGPVEGGARTGPRCWGPFEPQSCSGRVHGAPSPACVPWKGGRPGLGAGGCDPRLLRAQRQAQNWVTAETGSDDLLRLAGSDFVLPRKARPCPQRLPASKCSFVLSIQEAEERGDTKDFAPAQSLPHPAPWEALAALAGFFAQRPRRSSHKSNGAGGVASLGGVASQGVPSLGGVAFSEVWLLSGVWLPLGGVAFPPGRDFPGRRGFLGGVASLGGVPSPGACVPTVRVPSMCQDTQPGFSKSGVSLARRWAWRAVSALPPHPCLPFCFSDLFLC